MKNVLKAAHKLTKEIKAEYPNVDYKFQLGLCISYLSNKEENKMLKLQGSEKQIVWAEEIRSNMVNMLEEKINLVTTDKKATRSEVVSVKDCFLEARTIGEGRQLYIKALEEVKEALLLKQDSRWFIAYKNMDSETLVCNYVSHKETVFPEVR